MNGLRSFFQLSYLFNMRPEPLSVFGLRILLSVFFLLFLIGVGIGIAMNAKKGDRFTRRGLKSLRNNCIVTSMLGIFYTWAAFEGAVFLSARFWLWLLFLVSVVWGMFPLYFFIHRAPKLREEIKQRHEFEKYLR